MVRQVDIQQRKTALALQWKKRAGEKIHGTIKSRSAVEPQCWSGTLRRRLERNRIDGDDNRIQRKDNKSQDRTCSFLNGVRSGYSGGHLLETHNKENWALIGPSIDRYENRLLIDHRAPNRADPEPRFVSSMKKRRKKQKAL